MADRADVVVIGGGVIGLSVAYELAGQGVSVHVFDQGPLAQEASWAGAGILPPGNREFSISPEQRLRSLSHERWPALCEELQSATGIDNGYRVCGGMEIQLEGLSDQRISELAKDLVEVLRDEALEALEIRADARVAFHCPCTLQHAQKLGGAVEDVLRRLGFTLTAVPDAHLCCGSAGTYSLTQPEISFALRDRKLDALESGKPDMIVTANIGCQTHLAGAGRTPVRHWIEIVDEALGHRKPGIRPD